MSDEPGKKKFSPDGADDDDKDGGSKSIGALESDQVRLLAARTAALNVMQDAMLAKRRADELNENLRQEITERKHAEALARASERRYRAIVDQSAAGIASVSVRGNFTYANAGLSRMLGYTPDELVGKNIRQLTHPDHLEETLQLFDRLVSTGEPFEVDKRIIRRDGSAIWATVAVSPVGDEEGRIESVSAIFIDITERRSAESELARTRDRMRLIVESSVDIAIFTTDLNRVIDSWNPGAAKMTLFSEEEACGMSGDDIFTLEDRALGAPETEFRTALESGRAANERWHVRKDGALFYGSGLVMPLRDDNGEAIGVVKIMRDLTAQKEVEEALRLSEERVRIAVDAAQMGTWIWNITGNEVIWNEQHYRLLGLEPGSGREDPKLFFDHIHPDDRDRVTDRIQQAIETRSVFAAEFRVVREDGGVGWMQGYGQLIETNESGPLRMSGVMSDVTERRMAEEALRQSEERYQLAADAVQSVIYDWDIASDGTTRSRELWNLLGFDPDDPDTRSNEWFRSRLHPDDRDRVVQSLQDALRDGDRFESEFRVQHRDGHYITVLDIGRFVRDADGTATRCVGSVTDITRRKEIEAELLEHQARLEEMVIERTAQLATTHDLLLAESKAREEIQAERLALLKRILTMQEDERKRIARNMHDHFGQQITALRLSLDLLAGKAESHELKARIAGMQDIATSLDSDINFIVWELRPVSLDDLGLAASLADLAAKWSRQTNILVDFHAGSIDETGIAADVQTALYRIAQEALNNIARHSAATRASVLLECAGNDLTLIIEDNGKGFDTERSTRARKGLGLSGMRERAESAGGRFMVESLATAGTTVYVSVPMSEK